MQLIPPTGVRPSGDGVNHWSQSNIKKSNQNHPSGKTGGFVEVSGGRKSHDVFRYVPQNKKKPDLKDLSIEELEKKVEKDKNRIEETESKAFSIPKGK